MLILTTLQKVLLTITPVDAAGNPAPVDGVPDWTVCDPTVLTLEVASDGMSAYAITTGTVGGSQVSVSADADLGEGIVTITGVLEIDVQAAQAVALNIAAGVPEPK